MINEMEMVDKENVRLRRKFYGKRCGSGRSGGRL